MAEAEHCPVCGTARDAAAPGVPCPVCLMQLGLESWSDRAAADPAHTPTRISPGGFAAPELEELQPLFPQLELLELLGKGGMGAVYLARQKSLDRHVALKIINPNAAADPDFAERFSREARSLARLNHPNIVTVHDFGESGGLYYFVMEHVDGLNLRQILRDKTLTPPDALRIIPPLCEALQYAHDEGVVHRDIKPENILLGRRGRVKIADFGLAKLISRSPQDVTLTAAHQAMGTLHYMAPEQMERPLEVDHRADIFALGVTFYEMLTGKLPLGRFAPPSQSVHVDVRLDDVVLRALEREPERRYQNASDVKTDLDAIASSSPVAVPPPSDTTSRPPEPDWWSRQTRRVRQATSESRLGQSFQEFWRQAPRPVQMMVHIVLALVYLGGLTYVFGFSGARQPDHHFFELGRPEPWLTVRQIQGEAKWGLHFNWTLLAGAIGLAALLLERTLTRIERRPEHSFSIHVAFWGWLLTVASGVGLTSILLHADRLPIDRPDEAGPEYAAVTFAVVVHVCLTALGLYLFGYSLLSIWRERRAARRAVSPAQNPSEGSGSVATPSAPTPVFTAGGGSRLLAIALSLLFAAIMVLVGIGLLAYAFAIPESGARWGLAGAGGGILIGGLGSLFGTWCNYRRFRGAADVMQAPDWTGLDTLFTALTVAGLAAVAAAAVYWSRLEIGPAITLLLLGAMLSLNGLSVSIWRWAHRRAVRLGSGADTLDPRLLLIAGGMLLGGLMMASGTAACVYALLYQPGGPELLGGWMGGSFGFFFGGVGTLFASWNGYRKLEGEEDVWAIGAVTWFEWVLGAWTLIGLVALGLGLLGPADWPESLRWSLVIIAAILLFHSLVFGVTRGLTIRAGRRERARQQSSAQLSPP